MAGIRPNFWEGKMAPGDSLCFWADKLMEEK